ncbi:hypothetical protein [Fervidobacterium sp.]
MTAENEALHPLARAFLKVADQEGVLVLERREGAPVFFHVADGFLLKATGLISLRLLMGENTLAPGDLEEDLALLREVEAKEGLSAAWWLAAGQATATLLALPSLPGKKKLGFVPEPAPEALRRFGAGYRLTPGVLSLFFPTPRFSTPTSLQAALAALRGEEPGEGRGAPASWLDPEAWALEDWGS